MPRGAQTFCILALLAAAATTAVSIAVSATVVSPEKPIAAEVYVKGNGRATQLRGSMIRFDDKTFTLRVGADTKQLLWTDVTPATAFALKQKTVDRNNADECLALGKFGWSIGAKEQAQATLRNAVRLNAALKPQADAVLTRPAGYAVPAATQPAGKELITEGDGPAVKSSESKPADPKSSDPSKPATPTKYQPATSEDIAEAMKRTRDQAGQVEKTIGVKLAEFETDHFIIFTDWDRRENEFLKTNLEGAYRVVSKQFEMDPKDNVFVGKLPVYMLANYRDFENFAKRIDKFADVNNRTAGYYMGNSSGFGHMAMWKPNETLTGNSSMEEARRLWAYVLVHEFTHAFLARYKSNEFVPRWLNEGIAEVIAYNQFPYANRRQMAKMIARNNIDLMFLFDDARRPTGEYYPVMQTMVELLVSANKQNFLKLVDAIKDGRDPEEAMKELYHADYAQFVKKWREWMKNRPDN